MKDRGRNCGGRELVCLVMLVLFLSGAALGQDVNGVFDFNDRTLQGWTMEGAFIGEDGPLASNFTHNWSDLTNYPSAVGADPLLDNQGSFEMYTPGGHGMDIVDNWWRMVIRSPDLTESIPWQNSMGYSVKIARDFPGSGAQIYVNLMIQVYDLDLRHDRYFTTGMATAVPEGVWTERAFIRPSWGFPKNYIVREVFLNVWGWIPYGPWLYEGSFHVDEVTPIKDEFMYVDDDGGGPSADGSRSFPFDTIQEAIDAVEIGKDVVIRDGLYQGLGNRDIDFQGKAITVRSENGPVNCVIDCQGTSMEYHRGFEFSSMEEPNSVLMGVTIQNGYTSRGGGIYCRDSSPTIADCSIVSNTATNLGGGIYNENSSPIIEGCYLTHNQADIGGGIYCDNSSSATIRSSALVSNAADLGGGICCNDSTVNISTMTLTYNIATTSGGAIYSSSHGIADISNSIIWGNTPNAIFLVSGAASVDYSDIQGGWGSGTGNISIDPELMTDNYHLDFDSPCIDFGDPLGVFTDQTDIDGHPRVISSRVDMGANEFSPQIHNETQDSYHYTIQESINAA
ncbi:MAG: hypothetical protein GY869_05975, partial [Planctomycetes bacterium]|nr:hypothetical protein [Planctomycetota bacterium]